MMCFKFTVTICLIAIALPSSAFGGTAMFSAFASASHAFKPSLLRPLSVRGGQQSLTRNNMSNGDDNNNNVNMKTATIVKKRQHYPLAPVFSNSPFAIPVKKVTIAGGTHGNDWR